MDELAGYIVNNKPSGRIKLEDKVHISGEQIETYFMVNTTEGYRILEKYSGIKCGRKIAEKAEINGENEALEYAQKILKQERVGLLQKPVKRDNTTTIQINESIYSTGVKNINLKLDTFLAGFIEGLLIQSTNQKWTVEETKCQANGDEHCQFTCRRV